MKRALLVSCVLVSAIAGLLVGGSHGGIAADEPSASSTGEIKGLVVYGKDPVPKAEVSLEGANRKSVTTDAKGEFVFKDLPPGDYKVVAQGRAKNYLRKGSGRATVEAKAAKPASLTIKLN
jgi:carboxypeptidase family protein